MLEHDQSATILLADIVGSTQLYDEVGNAAALEQVVKCIDRLSSIIRKAGGTIIVSKGDDLLSTFGNTSSGLEAVRQILVRERASQLQIHAGLHFGHVIPARGTIYGDAVNLTARLAALAKPGEALMSESFVRQLPESDIPSLRTLDHVGFKGKRYPIKVYSLLEGNPAQRTEFELASARIPTLTQEQCSKLDSILILEYGGHSIVCRESMSVSIGRSADCDIRIERRWVSRKHATVAFTRGKIQLVDQSSLGTYVSVRGDDEIFIRREPITLINGPGFISPGRPSASDDAELIFFETDRRGRGTA